MLLQLQYIILYGLKQLNGERTAASVYHLLKGKRSSQTLQDGKIYRISFMFGLFKKIERHEYDEHIRLLLNNNFIKKIQENTYVVTKAGDCALTKYAEKYPFPKYIDGLRFGEAGTIFWKRLALLVQTLSHLQNEERHFLPIQQETDITFWTKQFLTKSPYKKELLAFKLYEECRELLSAMSELEAAIFTLRLSRYGRVGLTIEQISLLFSLEVSRTHVLFLSVLHFMMDVIEKEPNNYPLLRIAAISNNKTFSALSHSTQKTFSLLKQGKNIEEIAQMRNLKINTIEDHIVEIALNDPSFTVEAFVSNEKIKRIAETATRLQTRKLRELKQSLGEDIQYFEIRLVLAKLGGSYET